MGRKVTAIHRATLRFMACASIAALAFGVLECSIGQSNVPRVTAEEFAVQREQPDIASRSKSRPVRIPNNTQTAATTHASSHAPSSSWPKLFDASTDLRAFVADARRDPTNGGDFYALRALAECRLQALDQPPAELEPGAEFRAQELAPIS